MLSAFLCNKYGRWCQPKSSRRRRMTLELQLQSWHEWVSFDSKVFIFYISYLCKEFGCNADLSLHCGRVQSYISSFYSSWVPQLLSIPCLGYNPVSRWNFEDTQRYKFESIRSAKHEMQLATLEITQNFTLHWICPKHLWYTKVQYSEIGALSLTNCTDLKLTLLCQNNILQMNL